MLQCCPLSFLDTRQSGGQCCSIGICYNTPLCYNIVPGQVLSTTDVYSSLMTLNFNTGSNLCELKTHSFPLMFVRHLTEPFSFSYPYPYPPLIFGANSNLCEFEVHSFRTFYTPRSQNLYSFYLKLLRVLYIFSFSWSLLTLRRLLVFIFSAADLQSYLPSPLFIYPHDCFMSFSFIDVKILHTSIFPSYPFTTSWISLSLSLFILRYLIKSLVLFQHHCFSFATFHYF
jgi:hypothetical protein